MADMERPAPQDGTSFNVTDMFGAANGAMRSSIELAGKGSQQFADAWCRFSAEFLRFASHRLAAQAELLSGLRSCKDADEVIATEARFIENAADEYGEEFTRLAAVAKEAAEEKPAGRAAARRRAG